MKRNSGHNIACDNECGGLHQSNPLSLAKNEISSTLSWFMTDNALYPGVDKHSSPLRYENWSGRYSEYISRQEAESIVSRFICPEKDENFTLFFVSDYKDTYLGKNFLKDGSDIYLKHYRMTDAPREIRLRNVLRRCLARKNFNAFYQLHQKNIEAVKPLFYVMKRGRWIPDEVIAVSKGASGNKTIETLMADSRDNDEFRLLAVNLGSYVAELQSREILFKELYRNLIAVNQTTHWDFILCDLDEIRSVSEKRLYKHRKHVEKLRKKIKRYGDAFLHAFDQGYQTRMHDQIALSRR